MQCHRAVLGLFLSFALPDAIAFAVNPGSSLFSDHHHLQARPNLLQNQRMQQPEQGTIELAFRCVLQLWLELEQQPRILF